MKGITFLNSMVALVLSTWIFLLIPCQTSADGGANNPDTTLKYDTGVTAVEAPRLYKEGYIVDFTPPNIQYAINKILIYGTVKPGSSRNEFDLEILDRNYKVLFGRSYPISVFTAYPTVKWVDFDIPNIVVTGKFYIHVYKGFMESYEGLFLSAGYNTDPGGHVNTTTRVRGSEMVVDTYWPYGTQIQKENVSWMVRVVGQLQGKTVDVKTDFDYVLQKSKQVVNVLSRQKSKIMWDLVLVNRGKSAIQSIELPLRSPVATLTVNKVSAGGRNLNFNYLVGQPILPGVSGEGTIRINFSDHLLPEETLNFSLEIDAQTDKPLDDAYAYCRTDRIFGQCSLTILTTREFNIDRVDPPQAEIQNTRDGVAVRVEAMDVKELKLVAHLIPSSPGQDNPPKGTVIPPVPVPPERPNTLITAIVAALVLSVAIVAFIVYRFYSRRLSRSPLRITQAADREEYEKILEQWEKEGYDVDDVKKKLHK